MEVIVNGNRIHCLQKGNGKKYILFLHGWGGSSESFLPIVQRLEGRYRMVLVDFPPFGQSETPNRPMMLQDYVEILEKIIEVMQLEDFAIVAHSFGARVALKYCAKTGFTGAVLLTGAAGIPPRRSIRYYWKRLQYRWVRYRVRRNRCAPQRLEAFASPDYRALQGDMRKTFQNIIGEDLTLLLPRVRAQVLLYFGKDDKETPMYMARKMQKGISGCVLIQAEGGHFAYLENAIQFCGIIENFIKE